MRDFEISIIKGATELLNAHTDRLAACNLMCEEPELLVWQTKPERYTTELRIMILKRGDIHDVLEFDIYSRGEPNVTEEEALSWLNKELEKLGRQDELPRGYE